MERRETAEKKDAELRVRREMVACAGVVEGGSRRVGSDVAASRSVYDTLGRFEG